MESIRKDIECVFGSMSKRFRILQHNFLFSNPRKIELVFKTCVCLHNMLIREDGYDRVGEEAQDWIVADVDADAARVAADRRAGGRREGERSRRANQPWLEPEEQHDGLSLSLYSDEEDAESPVVDMRYEAFRDRVVKNYIQKYRRNEVLWLKAGRPVREAGDAAG